MKIYFDIQHLYYLPQYLPVNAQLTKQGMTTCFVLYQQEEINELLIEFVKNNNLDYTCVTHAKDAKKLYLEEKPDWIIFGNAFDDVVEINQYSNTALMQHGIGPKSCYYDVSESGITYRFVEGEHRLKRLQKRFPDKIFIDIGYAKLDPIINNTGEQYQLADLGLDPQKPTLLYAPTFYPSSIECFPLDFPKHFSKYNIIIKPHFFSFIKRKYKKHIARFDHWQHYDNVYLSMIEQTSILPFMKLADIMISDASSTLFEFTALNKPAIWSDFYKVRWSYRGIFKRRLKNRLDEDLQYFSKVAQQVTSFPELVEQTKRHLKHPELKENDRQAMTEKLAGKVDGNCSARIVEFIQETGSKCA